MNAAESFELQIDVFTPETIPMLRLAEYLSNFAELLGENAHVHFHGLKAGSVCAVALVEPVAIPKVKRRLDEVRYGAGPAAAQKAYREIDDLLAEDNAVGQLLFGSTHIIDFPGRRRHPDDTLGPVTQPASLDGEVIQIGGRDQSVNVHLRSGDRFHRCVTTKAIARRIAAYLFGPAIRVHGTGTFERASSGDWLVKRFEISDFEVLDETPLSKLFEGLRSRLAPPPEGRANPIESLRALREE
ncbi:MAG: hypothetical protein JNL98_22850 [Bryobacterales bacterium]|nr:hypothetical protein [Bryobacterales bacterium]